MEFKNRSGGQVYRKKAEEGEVEDLLSLYEGYWLGKVGIDPQIYYLNTIRNNAKIAKAWETKQALEWERSRYLAFSIYKSAYSFGKPVFKSIKRPQQLFSLETDRKYVKIKYDRERAESAVNRMKNRWQQQQKN